MKSALYIGSVVHARVRPKRHRLRYRVFSLLLDLDELEQLKSCVLGYNRWALLSVRDRDHGDSRTSLRAWAETRLREAGLDFGPSVRIQMLCYPRILGYVFNPLTVWFCRDAADTLRAILYEVHNTFGERRTYVIPVTEPGDVVKQSCAKELYVSPFVPMDCTYDFTIVPPDERVMLKIDEFDADGYLLGASFSGERRELTDWAMVGALLEHPLMTLKVMGAIHWEALKIWLKGVPYIDRKPATQKVASTVVQVEPVQSRQVKTRVTA